MRHTITHPHALAAVQLANLDYPRRAHVSLALRETRTPRSLYTLARVLRAAQLMDRMAALDAVNAALPAVVARAA